LSGYKQVQSRNGSSNRKVAKASLSLSPGRLTWQIEQIANCSAVISLSKKATYQTDSIGTHTLMLDKQSSNLILNTAKTKKAKKNFKKSNQIFIILA